METEHRTTTVHHAEGKNPMAFLSYLSILVIVPLVTDAKNDPFVKYHIKQGLALLIFEVIGWLIGGVIGFIPLLGWLIIELWWLTDIVLIIIGLINVANGKEKPLPLIGQYAKNFSF
jgi:uncharacterized membrane protein